ncbi:type II toxin-antitoxin system RelE/ParE family toxin [bacterium]|nr:type II toxin-antitoxin system RelE/ParE family toxin [bacterium]
MNSYDLEWTPLALSDLLALRSFIEEESADRASRFIRHLVEKCLTLRSFPLSGKPFVSTRFSDCRELVVPPCRIVYRTRGSAVQILRVWHNRQQVLPDELD